MALLAGFDYELFVSYATVNDQPEPTLAEVGWVTTFLRILLSRVDREVGVKDSLRLWRDKRSLSVSDSLGAEIKTALERSAALLVIASKGYLKSGWCAEELQWFRGSRNGRAPLIFIIDIDNVGGDERFPAELKDLLRAQFWFTDPYGKLRTYGDPKPRGDEQEYYDRLTDLARDIATKLQEMAPDAAAAATAAPTVAVPAIGAAATGRVVFLARPASDMVQAFERVGQELLRHGFAVAPPIDQKLPEDAAAQAFIDGHLQAAEVSIHLLGDKAGTAIAGSPAGKLQLARAGARYEAPNEEQGRPPFRRLIWAPKVMGADQADADAGGEQRDPLEVLDRFDSQRDGDRIEGDVSVSKFVEFVLQHLALNAPRRATSDPIRSGARIYVEHHPADADYALSLAKALRQRQIKAELPAQEGDPKEIEAFNAQMRRECEAIVLCWANGSEVWVRATSRSLRDLHALGRTADFSRRALVAGPPQRPVKPRTLDMLIGDEIDVALDLSAFDKPPADKLDPLVT
jgi:hypothetical protein